VKKLGATLLSLALVLGLAAVSSAETYKAPGALEAKVGESILTIDELSNFNWDSRREAQVTTAGNSYAEMEAYLCPNEKIIAQEAPCDFYKSGNGFFGSNMLPTCEGQEDFCIESLSFKVGGQVLTGRYLGGAGGQAFDAIPEFGIQSGGQISLFEVAGATNSAGVSTYGVAVRSRQDFNPREKRFETISMDLAVFPYSEQRGSFTPNYRFEFVDANGKNKVGLKGGSDCMWPDTGVCRYLADFVGEPEISLSVRSSTELAGWFRGRLTEPNISVEPFSKLSERVTITGKPVTVPRFHAVATSANTPASVRALFPVGSGGSGKELFEGSSSKGAFSTDARQAYTLLEGMRAAVNDTAAGLSTMWSLESIGLGSNPCFAKQDSGLIGIVTTNATSYDGTVPGFSGGQLTYKVAGLHYAPGGEKLNLGTYDLVMRSDTARCLYGFSSAPVQASISVLTEKGEPVVATTQVSEKNGWLKLAAYGFTFSEKNIRVKLTQQQSSNLTKFTGRSIILTAKQKAEVRSSLTKASGNSKFICTGTFVKASDRTLALQRARAACNYAKSLNKNFSFFAQAKVTKAASFDGRVMVVSK